MINIYQREFTEKERKQLQKLIPGFWKRIEGFVIKLLMVFMLSLVPILLVEELTSLRLMERTGFVLIWILTTLVIALYFSWREENIMGSSKPFQDISKGLVEVIECEIDGAVMVEEYEDFGLNYFLDVGNDQTLFLSGRYLYQLAGIRQFPARKIILIRTPETHILIDLSTEGEYIAPIRTEPPFSKSDYQEGNVPGDGELINKSFSSLPVRT